MAGLTNKRRWLIRRIFLQRHDEYSLTEAAKALGIRSKEVVRMIESEDIEAEVRVEYRITWESLADAAMEKWPLEIIFAALGEDSPRALPVLLNLTEITATVPAYLRLAIEYEAEKTGRTFDDCLRDILHDAATALRIARPGIDEAIPGFLDALMFPHSPDDGRKS